MGARPVELNVNTRALYISIMWLSYIYPDVACIDVDHNAGRVALFGMPERTKEFNDKLELMMIQIHSSVEAWKLL